MEEREDTQERDIVREPEERQPEDGGWDAARERFGGEQAEAQPLEPEPQESPSPESAEAPPISSEAQAAPQEQPAPVDWEARSRALEAENQAMREALASRRPEQAGRGPELQGEQPKAVPISEDMKAEARAFAEQYPDLAGLLTEDSPAGRLLRKKLGEYGADEAAAYAIPIGESRRAAQASQRVAQDLGQRSAEAQVQHFWNAVEQVHPDVMGVIRSGKGGQLVEELRSWAKSKSYEEGSALLAAIERSGDAQGTIGVLTRWKREMEAAQTDQPTGDQRKDIARSMAAVPSRGSQTPAPAERREPSDGWDAAKRRWG